MNVDIERVGNKIRIKLNKDFYDMDSIRKAAEDFSGVCSTVVNNKEGFGIILTSRGNKDIKILGYEFCNYVLALMKNNNVV